MYKTVKCKNCGLYQSYNNSLHNVTCACCQTILKWDNYNTIMNITLLETSYFDLKHLALLQNIKFLHNSMMVRIQTENIIIL